MSQPSNPNNQADTLQIPLSRVIGFVRQLSHDLRNHLNAAELQAAYMNEVTTDAEMKSEVLRLRGMFSDMGSSLQKLSGALAEIRLTPMPYEAPAFMEDLRSRLQSQFPEEAKSVQWTVEVEKAQLNIDPQNLQAAFLELFGNAFQHSRSKEAMEASAAITASEFIFTLREPKTQFEGSTDKWGHEPFAKVMHGHYGLGLHRARSIIEAHGGQFEAQFDPARASLFTTIALPIHQV
ncbi:MAG: hypothetical protein M3128_08945 [Verrucomicrobiota bacterium]|nr:hypothetical protein [Verrucomicrobiota bacterium]